MSEETPTTKLALKIWCAILWRVLRDICVVFAISVFFAVIFEFFAFDTSGKVLAPYILILMMIGGILSCIYNIRNLMISGFGKYRLVVVNK
jgi:hypothetical protein